MYDLIIIGGGPAGVAAGIYASRKKIHTLIITESFGGQSEVSTDIQNWIGSKSISGFDLARALEEHIRAQESITIVTGERVSMVMMGEEKDFHVSTDGGTVHRARAVIVASGSRRKKLGVPGEDDYNGRGVAYCSTCDAPLFSGKEVAVVGSGNAGLEAALDLVPYAKKVHLLGRGPVLKGDPITQERVRGTDINIITNAETTKITGDKENKFVASLEYRDTKINEIKHLAVGGVFVEIGAVPNSDIVKDLVELNKKGEIIIDHRSGASSREGIWAAGDVTDVLYKQNNISAGDAVKAALSVYSYLQNLEVK
jgi:alkyl hydroperoxide reductase subunit F